VSLSGGLGTRDKLSIARVYRLVISALVIEGEQETEGGWPALSDILGP